MSLDSSILFTPVNLGGLTLRNRVVMAPLTRNRAIPGVDVPQQLNAEYYSQRADAAVVYVNASTAFTDGGQFGMGAEIGTSTQKLHARGPMGLDALTSYKWIVWGQGQVRE